MAAAEARVRRYRAAEQQPLVQELRKAFEADVIARELLDREGWAKRVGEGG